MLVAMGYVCTARRLFTVVDHDGLVLRLLSPLNLSVCAGTSSSLMS
jgi:hypothetical protein